LQRLKTIFNSTPNNNTKHEPGCAAMDSLKMIKSIPRIADCGPSSKMRKNWGQLLFLYITIALLTLSWMFFSRIFLYKTVLVFHDKIICIAHASEASCTTLEDYQTALTKKYPAQTATIKNLLNEYPYWVITLEEKYGLPPILAMKNRTEADFAVLFRDPDLFMDVYEHIPKKVGNEEKRANYALLLSNALSISETTQIYEQNLARALAEDSQSIEKYGVRGTSFKRFMNRYPQPQNYFQVLKKNPEQLAVFLEFIQKMDYRTVARFISSPNAGAFLLTTGLEGSYLLEKYGEEVLFLSLFLSEADQKRLPDLFRRYPDLGLVIEETGMEGFLIFLSAPEFFDRFLSQFYNDRRFGCVLGQEYIKMASEHLGQERFQKIAGGLDRDYLTGALGEIAKRYNKDGTPGYNCIISDPYVTEFLIKFRNRGKNVLGRFCNYHIAESIIRYWGPSWREMEVAIEAIEQYGLMGIQAVNHFRHDDKIKVFSGEYGVKALMVLHYIQNPSEQARIFSDREDALSKYQLDAGTGYPRSVKTGAVEFVPGYDLVSTCYDSVKHGRLPSFGEVCWSAFDVVDIGLTIATIGGWEVTGGAVMKAGKAGLKSAGKAVKSAKVVAKPLKKSSQNLVRKGYQNIKRALPKNISSYSQGSQKKSLRQFSDDLFKTIRNGTKGVGRNLSNDYWFVKLRAYQPNATIQNVWTNCGKWAHAAKIRLVKPVESSNRSFAAMRPWATWQTRAAKELGEELLLGTLCYEGVSVLEDRVTAQLRKRLKEKTK